MSNEYRDWERDKIEEEKEIVAKYPFLHVRDIDGSIDTESKFLMIGLEIPDGWYELFFQMCDDIKPLVSDDFYFIQVKEKYNYLRCYTANSNAEVDAIIAKYEQMTFYICNICGAPADKLTTDYIASFCENCYEDNLRHLKVDEIKLATEYHLTGFKDGQTIVEIISFKDEWDRYMKRLCEER